MIVTHSQNIHFYNTLKTNDNAAVEKYGIGIWNYSFVELDNYFKIRIDGFIIRNIPILLH